MSEESTSPALRTLSFDEFWSWAQLHLNCVLRAGSADVVIFDDEDLHWHFGMEDADTYLVQVIRGKRMLAELAMHPGEIAFVQGQATRSGPSSAGPRASSEQLPPEEVVFDLIGTAGGEPLYQFVMAHDYEDPNTQRDLGEESGGPIRWTH